ncbi:MAG TPA: PepSY domain-containing protein [Rhodanobacter sp.]
MITRRRLFAFAVTLPLLAFAGLASPEVSSDKASRSAAKKLAQQEALEALQRGEILPLTQVLDIALRQVPGKVIEVEYEAGPQYEIKILTPDGRIREVELDARTGDVLKIKDKS